MTPKTLQCKDSQSNLDNKIVCDYTFICEVFFLCLLLQIFLEENNVQHLQQSGITTLFKALNTVTPVGFGESVRDQTAVTDDFNSLDLR